MTRRDFFRFMVLGSIVGYFSKKIKILKKPRKAKFWRKVT